MVLLGAVAAAAAAFARCGGCDEDPLALFSVDNVLQCQKASDLLISLAYFSIPLELFYFVTCSTIFPFRWIFLQFGAFIVLCGLTHFVTVFTYAPHSFLLMLVVTVLKFLTALVSVATAITLVPLIPQILRVFVREGLLRKKTRELDREVGLMKRQEEARWHVREITREIRRHLDRHSILDTALVELSKVLFLENCAIWTADPGSPGNMVLKHEMKPRRRGRLLLTAAAAEAAARVPIDDPEVAQIVCQNGVVFLGRDSRLVCCGEDASVGPAAAIRIPTLRASNLGAERGGNAPALVDEFNTILVLVLPPDGEAVWTDHDLEIIEVVANQVAVGLSHAAAMEETLMMREKLLERNAMLKRAQREAVMANDARVLFRKVMSREMTAPVRSVVAVLSALQLEKLKPEQMAMVKGGLLLSSLIEDSADVSRSEECKLELNLRPFNIRPALEEAVAMSRLLCSCRGASLSHNVSGKIPSRAVGDERRILQAILYMVAHVLGPGDQGSVLLRIQVEEGSQGAWKQGPYEDSIKLGFEVSRIISSGEDCSAMLEVSGRDVRDQGPSIAFCEQLAELMDGCLLVGSASQSLQKSMNLLIRLQAQRSDEGCIWPRYSCSEDNETSQTLLEGMRILLVDGDVVNRSISRKIFEKFGCHLAVASSWYECFESLYLKGNKFHLLLIDLFILNEEGQDTSSRMRKLYSEGWLITIALVPKTDKDVQEECTKIGVHGVIRKPIVLQEVVNELTRITQRLQASPALQQVTPGYGVMLVNVVMR
ncbi:hypothetical protein Taro_035023 [Colocasia esculenta]|uniref:Ethylene receptor n=1 Tax=Colocasia esculenta TaxID=4460 RepID=A0A843W2J3_COLES|nr:hypothetical protein [Colocasia esculenta]